MLKPTGFNRFQQFGQVIVESVEDHIQPAAFSVLVCCWIPESHMNILFEYVFENKLVSQQNKESYTLEPAPNHPNQPLHVRSTTFPRTF